MTTSSDTPAESSTRELAAIMFSDIAGYTAIMGRDEQAGIGAVAAHRELLRTLLPKFNGRVLGEAGDGALSSFHSAVDAVNCAREMQTALKDDPQLTVRIGIHVGDVVFSNGTVLGDGVNVASRIQALAPPGGIWITDKVYDEVRNKPETHAKYLGKKRLKNVSRPTPVYALTDASVGTEAYLGRGWAGLAANWRGVRRALIALSIAVFGLVLLKAFYVELATAALLYVPRLLPASVHQQIGFCTTSDGVRIAYGTSGKGPPIVVVVGWLTDLERGPSSPTYGSAFLKQLGAHHLVVQYDGRGFGLSDRGLRDYSLQPRLRDLEAVVDALRLQKFTLFAISAGGPAAIAYAALHPERVNRIVLYATYAVADTKLMDRIELERLTAVASLLSTGWSNPAFQRMFASLVMPNGNEVERRFFIEVANITATPEDAAAFMLAGGRLDITEFCPRIKAPTLVISIRGDQLVPFALGKQMADLIPGARIVPIEGVDHLPVPGDGESEQLDEAIGPFLH